MTAKPIFIGGTGSHVGKSWVATALCRHLRRMGHGVAPFKAQNMSNNSMVCSDGGEIGRAQYAQAEACGLQAFTDMNPILLKPTGSLGCQVILHGRPWRNLSATEYYNHFDFLLEQVLQSYRRLAAEYEYIIVEGAGSVTELNLKTRDLVNLGLAARVNAPALLVADIDRGGVFASIVGTVHLLEAGESRLLRSFLINRFRGDPALFKDGVRILEEKTGRPCLGVFPFREDIYLDAEDSVGVPNNATGSRIAIIRLPHISNFTDFRLIPDATYISRPTTAPFDTIILPGTKNTIDDLLWLRSTGLESWIVSRVRGGAGLVGVCGGFQMLGEEISDPESVESKSGTVRGLGLLPVRTRLAAEKTTRAVGGQTSAGNRFQGYEIHMGISTLPSDRQPFAILDDGTAEGIRAGRIIGTYLHGVLENPSVLEEVLAGVVGIHSCDKNAQYDRLADWFARNVNHDVLEREYLR